MIAMNERFKIYVEQLRDRQAEQLNESFDSTFLEICEKDLAFVDPVLMQGEAYLADDMLVLHMDISTLCTMPCRICNEAVKAKIDIKGCYHAVPLEEIKNGVYDFHEILRETILLEVPLLAECHQGKCPQRLTVGKYLKKSPVGGEEIEEGYQPFADIDFDAPPEKNKKNRLK